MELKTITIGAMEDNPDYSICEGHVDAPTFQKAHEAEGWEDGGDIESMDLKHEHWVPLENGAWKKSNSTDPEAKPVTVMEW